MYFHPFEVKLFIGQKKQFVPALYFLINLLKLLHISRQKVKQLQMELYLLHDLYLSRMGPIDFAVEQQWERVLHFVEGELPHFEHYSAVAGMGFHFGHKVAVWAKVF